jgi:hypothetical protein
MKDKFLKLDGAEVGHWPGHENFDNRVSADLTDIQSKLQEKYSAPISDWPSHPQRDRIAADLEARISKLQSRTIKDIESGNVPMTDEGTSGGMGRIN